MVVSIFCFKWVNLCRYILDKVTAVNGVVTAGHESPGSVVIGRVVTPGGCQIGYTDHTGCHQLVS
jgi:hypothetical protein